MKKLLFLYFFCAMPAITCADKVDIKSGYVCYCCRSKFEWDSDYKAHRCAGELCICGKIIRHFRIKEHEKSCLKLKMQPKSILMQRKSAGTLAAYARIAALPQGVRNAVVSGSLILFDDNCEPIGPVVNKVESTDRLKLSGWKSSSGFELLDPLRNEVVAFNEPGNRMIKPE